MAHEVESMMSVREVPWHGLGTIVPDVLTAQEALVAAGLDWEVDLYPLHTYAHYERQLHIGVVHDGDDSIEMRRVMIPAREVVIEGSFAVVRDSDLSTLGVVGGQYVPIQNHESFAFFDTLVDSGDAKYETAGSLKAGRVVFLTAKVPREIKIGGADAVDLYLVLSTSHDGSLAFRCAVTPVRVVCQNTLNYGLSIAQQNWSIRHTDQAEGKVAEARQALGLTFDYADAFEAEANRLLDQEFTKAEFERLVRVLSPSKKEGDGGYQTQMALIGTLESSATLDDGLRYTRWGALNAVAEYADWVAPVRSSKTKSEAESRTDRAWFGAGLRMKETAHKILTAAP